MSTNNGILRIEPSLVLGVDGLLKSQLHQISDQKIIYVAGHNIIELDVNTHSQRIVSALHDGPSIQSTITTCCLSPDKKYLAVAVRGERAVIIVYDAVTLRKRKVLSTVETISNQYVSMTFSPDSNSLLSQAGSPDYTLINWNWEKMKPSQIYKVPINEVDRKISNDDYNQLKCSFCPHDPSIIIVSGRNTLHVLGIAANSDHLVPLSADTNDDELRSYVDHIWIQLIPSRNKRQLLLLSEDGSIQLWTTDKYICELACSPKNYNDSNMICMNYDKRGFIVGTDSNQLLVFNTPSDEVSNSNQLNYEETLKYFARHIHLLQVSMIVPKDSIQHSQTVPSPVTTTTIVTNDTHITNVLDFNDMYIFIMANGLLKLIRKAELMENEIENINNEKHIKSVSVKPMLFSNNWHTNRINGMDVSERKPFVITCSSDYSIRVWNYQTCSLEVMKTFADEPLSVSIHPSAHHIIVGFADKVRLMNLMMNDIRTFKELPIKSCRECRFSHGGHNFAVVQGKTVVVYNFLTCDRVAEIRVHGTVKSIYWSYNDESIITAGIDGAVYEQKLTDKKKTSEWVQKTCKFHCAVPSKDGKIYVVGEDGYLKEILTNDVTKQIPVRSGLTQVAISEEQHVVFVATDTGIVRVFKYPLTGESYDIAVQSTSITRMCLTIRGEFLFVASQNGILVGLRLCDIDPNLNMYSIKGITNDTLTPYSSEVLLGRSDLEEYNSTMNDLKNTVEELKVHNAYQLRLHDINYQDQLKEITERYTLQLEQYKSKYEMLQDEKHDLQIEYEDRLKSIEDTHTEKLNRIDVEHQQNIMEQVRTYHTLELKLESSMSTHQKLLKQIKQKAKVAKDRQIEEFEALKRAEEAVITRLIREKELITRKFDETKLQLEDDTDIEIERLRQKYNDIFQQERESTLRLQAENGIMKKKFSSLRKDIEDQREEIKIMTEKEGQLYRHIHALEKEIENHITHIEKRDVVIGEKETQIYDLKKDNQELEKNKFVLDFQIKDLKRQIEPRDNKIQQLKNQILNVDHELESYHKQNADMESGGQSLQTQLSDAQTQVRRSRHRYREIETELERFEMKLELVIKHIQDPYKLRHSVEQLLSEYVPEPVPHTDVDPDVQEEYKRHKLYLQQNIGKLQKKMIVTLKQKSEENVRIMQENVALIRDINELRKKIQEMRMVKRKRDGKKGSTRRSREEMIKLISMQEQTIESLKKQIDTFNGSDSRAPSRTHLPPLITNGD